MAKSTLSNEAIKELLISEKKADVRKGVKLVLNNTLINFADDVFDILRRYLKDEKMWEVNYDIIRLLGQARYEKVIPILDEICNQNEDHDMVTSAAATALCRIKRANIHDVQEVQRLLTFGNFAVVDGALRSMGMDKVMPSENKIGEIINSVKEFEPKIEKGYADIREGLAVASAGWTKNELVKNFLDDCLKSGDSALAKLAKSSINSKYAQID
ncbi:HEAT repeat domain-containing protein [Pedobacter alluvionis]|uniref:HEAT repeat domain-containing protein n=1 Tax=Pedobacter alluvionis TaxID=475253 RepID=A0A497XRJ0_9SPHI|nr:HEAT repeat domain-containing protein [Pedobacter alluvionis]RLJ69332.1 hypothetical protein BCL90_5254 [Pedobacter alluvionis]TFB30294.1 HEAT repeat domain-containing protein [Pedobacter alluvionis]